MNNNNYINSMGNSDVVIIGNGVAGNSASSAIRKFDKNVKITMISDEIFPQYSPCLLPNYLSGEIKKQRVFLKNTKDYLNDNINAIFGQKAIKLDVKKKKVFLETESISYDKLIIATGGRPILPAVEGLNKKGVFTLKSIMDFDKISDYIGKKVVVVGSGPIGVETAIAFKKKGYKVFLVELLDRILPRVLDEKPSLLIRQTIEKYGIEVYTKEKLVKILGTNRVKGVATDKQKIECDLAVQTIGMIPNVELAQQAGLEIGKLGGVKVNEHMMTSANDVYACGDCVETRDIITGKYALSLLWHNAKLQGEIAGYNCIDIRRRYPGSINIVNMDILGFHVTSFGSIMSAFKCDSNVEVIERIWNTQCLRVLISDGVFVGLQSISKTRDIGSLLAAALRKDNIEVLKKIINYKEFLGMNPCYYRFLKQFRILA